MNNYEATVAILRSQREARAWTDEAVASDLLTQLGVDPAGEAKKATVAPPADDAPVGGPGLRPDGQPVSTHPLDLSPGTQEPNLPPVPAAPAQLEQQAAPVRDDSNDDPAQDLAKSKIKSEQSKADAKAEAKADAADSKR
jgi:hypothetical protein